MVFSRSYEQIKEGILRYINSKDKSRVVEVDPEIATLYSVLGKRQENQDRILFLRVKFAESSKPSIAALVICDGMGGMLNGGECSSLAISTFASTLIHSPATKISEKLEMAIYDANNAVFSCFQGEGGTTLSAVACSEDNDWAAINVGDSRIYTLSSNGILKQLTTDDTLEMQLADLNLSAPPPGFRQLVQYIGMGNGIQPRHVELTSLSEIKFIILTSDGAHNIPNDVFQLLITNAETSWNIAHRLAELSEWLGGRDNASIATLSMNQDVFFRNNNNHESYLEIWSTSGKVEFISVKLFQSEAATLKSTEVLTNQALENSNNTSSQDSKSQKKVVRKKKQRNHSETANNSIGEDKISAIPKEDDKPQLNIEFSEDDESL